MKKLNIFNRTLWKSISSITYYHEVVAAPANFSFKFFLMFSFFLGLISSLGILTVVLPPVTIFTQRFIARAPTLFPANLMIMVKNGEVSTNATEPLRFPIPYELFTDTSPAISDQKQKYLITIDTNSRVSDFSTQQSLILSTRTEMVVADNQNGYRVYPLKDAGDIKIDKQQADKFITGLTPLVRLAPVFIVLIVFSAFVVLLPASRLISLLVLTLILLAIARFMSLTLTYRKLYQIGLHSLTLPTLIQVFMSMWGLTPPIPFFGSLLFILYSLIILAELKKTPTIR